MLDNFRKNIVDPLLGRSHHHHEVDEDDSDSQTVGYHVFANCDLLTLGCFQAQTESDIHDSSHVRPDIESHWLSAMADTIQVPGCHCFLCMKHDNSVSCCRQV